MKLVYNPSANPMAKTKSFTMAKVTLKVGLNELTETQEKALKAHPDFDKFTELGVFDEAGDEPVKQTTRRKKASPIMLDMPE